MAGVILLSIAALMLVQFFCTVYQHGIYSTDYWMINIVLQSLVIATFGPLTAVGVISGERERGSLELLFLTPVSSRALVMQKFYAAVALLSVVLITFLPVMLAILLVGGVSLVRFIAEYLMLAAQIACAIAIGMLTSCLIKNTRNASAVAFVVTILLVFLLYGLVLPALQADYFADMPKTDQWYFPIMFFMPIFTLIAFLCIAGCIRIIERMRNPALYR